MKSNLKAVPKVSPPRLRGWETSAQSRRVSGAGGLRARRRGGREAGLRSEAGRGACASSAEGRDFTEVWRLLKPRACSLPTPRSPSLRTSRPGRGAEERGGEVQADRGSVLPPGKIQKPLPFGRETSLLAGPQNYNAGAAVARTPQPREQLGRRSRRGLARPLPRAPGSAARTRTPRPAPPAGLRSKWLLLLEIGKSILV